MSGILQGLLASIGAAGGPWLYAWGSNNNGQLGDETTIPRSSPVQIGSETNWSTVSGASRLAAAIKANGTLWMWGRNNDGQLGDGTTIYKSSPIQVGALTTWSKVSAGNSGCAAIKTDGTLWVWGAGNQGILGTGNTNNRSSPVQVGALTDWSQVSMSKTTFSCSAIKTDGTLWTWGYNYFGQLGDNTVITKSSPVQIGALTNWSQVWSGAFHMVAVKTNGTLWTWGYGLRGQIGNNSTINRSSPIQVGSLTTWSQVAANDFSSFAIKTDGTLWSWGKNNYGQLGTGDPNVDRSSPVQVGALTNWSKLSAGGYSSVSIKTDKTIWTWGYNGFGQLGDSTRVNKSSPIQVGANTWSVADSGSSFVLAIED